MIRRNVDGDCLERHGPGYTRVLRAGAPSRAVPVPAPGSMKTLEQRFARLFDPDQFAAARSLAPPRVTCPRVGQVHGVVDAGGGTHEVQLELAAHRRGGMTLEARCTSPAGRAGRPCAALAAVLLLSLIHI